MSEKSERVSVLCLDDAASATETARLLEAADASLTAHSVSTPQAAFDRIETHDVDCLVSAYTLPEIDGIQFLQAFRAEYPDLPFVLYAADGSEEIASAAFAADATDYLPRLNGHVEGETLATRIRTAVERRRARSERLARNERAKHVLEASPDAIVVTVDGEIVYANRAATDLFGVSDTTDLVGASLSSLTDTDLSSWLQRTVSRGDVLKRHRESFPMLEQKRVTVDMTANAVTWAEQDGVVVILRDVSDRTTENREKLRSRTQLEAILDTLSAAIFLKDTDGRYLLMNRRCREILGVDPSRDVHGMTDEEIFEQDVATRIWADDRRVFEAGETLEIEEVVPTVDGERTMLTRKTPLADSTGETYALCAVSTDITNQKQREHALSERVKELSAIHATVDLFESEDRLTDDILTAFARQIPPSFQYPERTEARVSYGSVVVETEGFGADGDSLTASAGIEGGTTVRIEVVCTAEPKGTEQDPFLPEERNLLETLSTVAAGYLERRAHIDTLQRYETTLRALGDPVYALDGEGRFTFVNDALLERTGYDSEQLMGEHNSVLLSDEGVETGDSVIRELLAAEGSQTAKWEMELQTADGESVPVENHIALLPTENGEFRGTAGVLRDISDRIRRQEELQRRRDMLVRTEQMADVGGWEYNLDTDQLYWTDGTRQIHGVSPDYEPTGEKALDFFHSKDRTEVGEALERCIDSGNPFDIEKRLITANGRERWVHLRGERVEENGLRRIRGSIQDITKLRESEQQLMVLNRVLRHNLRNNLNVVTANAELLRTQLSELEPFSELPTTERSEFPALVARNLPEGSELDPQLVETSLEAACEFSVVDATSNLERLEANAWELLAIAEKSRKLAGAIGQMGTANVVALDSLLHSLVEEYRLVHPDASITLDASDVDAEGNPASIRLAVEELLENALKHTGDAPTVSIAVRTLADERVEITVSDDGPGIPAIEREALEDGEETALKHGSGLGLWTVNWLLARLGGTVSIDETTSGTTVRIELPAA